MDKGFINIDINKLYMAEWNYKKNDEFIYEKLKHNIKENKQLINLIVRELEQDKFEVINGNHRLQVLKDLDYKEALCFNLGDISLSEAKRIAIETNEYMFKNNTEKLNSIIFELSNTYEDLIHTFPYTDEEIKEIIKTVKSDSEMGNDTMSELDSDEFEYIEEDIENDLIYIEDIFKNLGVKKITKGIYEKLFDVLYTIRNQELIEEGKEHTLIDIVYKYLARKTNNFLK